MTVIKVNDNSLIDRISEVEKLRTDWFVSLNKTDINYPDTTNYINKIDTSVITQYLNSNLNYLKAIKAGIVDVDQKYFQIEPTNYEDGLKYYEERYQNMGKSMGEKSFKGFDFIDGKKGADGKITKGHPVGTISKSILSSNEAIWDYVDKEDKTFLDFAELMIELGDNAISSAKSIAEWLGKDFLKDYFGTIGDYFDMFDSITSNYEEYGEFSERCKSEAVLEGLLTIGTKALYKMAGKAIGKAAGAIVSVTPAAPLSPVVELVVGEVSGVAISYTADYYCEYNTGESVVEYTSDTILNIIDNATNGALGHDSTRSGGFAKQREHDYLED